MRVVKLARGAGNGIDQACLATAVGMIAGEPAQRLDQPQCLCLVIRNFVIVVNDAMTDVNRERCLGDLPWVLIGTKTDSLDVMVQRAHICAWYAQCIWRIGAESVANHTDEDYGRSAFENLQDCCYGAEYAEIERARGQVSTAEVTAMQAAGDAGFLFKKCLVAMENGNLHTGVPCSEEFDLLHKAVRNCIIDMAKLTTPVEPVMSYEQLAEKLGVTAC